MWPFPNTTSVFVYLKDLAKFSGIFVYACTVLTKSDFARVQLYFLPDSFGFWRKLLSGILFLVSRCFFQHEKAVLPTFHAQGVSCVAAGVMEVPVVTM